MQLIPTTSSVITLSYFTSPLPFDVPFKHYPLRDHFDLKVVLILLKTVASWLTVIDFEASIWYPSLNLLPWFDTRLGVRPLAPRSTNSPFSFSRIAPPRSDLFHKYLHVRLTYLLRPSCVPSPTILLWKGPNPPCVDQVSSQFAQTFHCLVP